MDECVIIQFLMNRYFIDDYSIEDWGLGTQKLVSDDVLPYCSPSLIQTDRRWPGGEREHLPDDYSELSERNCTIIVNKCVDLVNIFSVSFVLLLRFLFFFHVFPRTF